MKKKIKEKATILGTNIKEKISLKLPGLMSIRNKLFVLLLCVGMTGTAITAYFSYQTAKDALEHEVF